MNIAATIDEIGKPAWIALMVLSFIVYWPLGLAMLAFLLWSGRMGCRHYGGRGPGRWWHEAEGAARVQGVFGASAPRQGQGRVRPVHGRARPAQRRPDRSRGTAAGLSTSSQAGFQGGDPRGTRR